MPEELAIAWTGVNGAKPTWIVNDQKVLDRIASMCSCPRFPVCFIAHYLGHTIA